MACYECGGEGGDAFRMCEPCIERKNRARDSRRRSISDEFKQQDSIDKLTNNTGLQASIAGVIITVLFCYFLFFGPVKSLGAGASLIFAGMVTSISVSGLTYLFFWVNMIVLEPMWAVGALIIPGLAYRFVYVRWDQAKFPFLMHVGSTAFTFLLCGIFAATQGVSFLETTMLLHLHTHGGKVEVGSDGKLMLGDPDSQRTFDALNRLGDDGHDGSMPVDDNYEFNSEVSEGVEEE